MVGNVVFVCVYVRVFACYICFWMRIHAEQSITGIRPLLTDDAKACREISQNILKKFPPSTTPYPHRHPVLFRYRFVAEKFSFAFLYVWVSGVCMLLAVRLFAFVRCCALCPCLYAFFGVFLLLLLSLFALNMNMMLFRMVQRLLPSLFFPLLLPLLFDSLLLEFLYVWCFYSLYWTSGCSIRFHLSAAFIVNTMDKLVGYAENLSTQHSFVYKHRC